MCDVRFAQRYNTSYFLFASTIQVSISLGRQSFIGLVIRVNDLHVKISIDATFNTS